MGLSEFDTILIIIIIITIIASIIINILSTTKIGKLSEHLNEVELDIGSSNNSDKNSSKSNSANTYISPLDSGSIPLPESNSHTTRYRTPGSGVILPSDSSIIPSGELTNENKSSKPETLDNTSETPATTLDKKINT